MKILIYSNSYKDPEGEYAGKLSEIVKAHGAEPVIYRTDGTVTETSAEEARHLAEDADAIFTLGGDGTVLQAARDTKSLHVPIAGVNLGKVGYLTEIERDTMEDYMERFFRKDYSIESRMMLNGVVTHADGGKVEGWSLNDVVITRIGSLQILMLDIYVNGQFLTSYHSDGVILTTPTGSTGYNLSAGGPIVEPGAKMITMTPICPHTLNQRSIILRAEDEVIIRIPDAKTGMVQTVEATFDGVPLTRIRTGDFIRVTQSEKTTEFIRFEQTSFLDVLHHKLGDH